MLPTARERSKVHWPRASLARFVPPSGFGYPLDGLLPSVPGRSFFIPAALLGFTLRRFSLQEGIRCVSARKHPLTVSLSGVPAAEAPSRPDEPRFLGFVPPQSPLRPSGCLVRRPPGPPLGFALPGCSGKGLGQDSARPPLSDFGLWTYARSTSPSESQSAHAWFLPLTAPKCCSRKERHS